MIKTFAHKGLEAFYVKGRKAGIQAVHEKRLRLILGLLDAAARPEDMNFPGSSFHGLSGKLAHFSAVKVNGNWRVVFRFEGQDAYDVDYVDYH